MCNPKIPHNLYGIQIDITTSVQPREYFMEYIETLPHIKKFNYENMTVWYIFEFSVSIRAIFEKFLEKQIGTKIRNFPWSSTLVSTFHNGLITRIDTDKPVYNTYIYGIPSHSVYNHKPSAFDTVTLTAQQLYNLTN